MKIGNKILFNMFSVILLTVVIILLADYAEMTDTGRTIQKDMEQSGEELYEANMSVVQGYGEQVLASFAENYAQSLSIRLEEIESCGRVLRNCCLALHNNGSMTKENIQAEIDYVTAEHKGLNIYYVSENGVSTGNVPLAAGGEKVDQRERPWYRNIKEDRTIVWTTPYYDIFTGQEVFTCAIPVLDENGDFLGGIALDVMSDEIQGLILADHDQSISYAYLVDENGSFLMGAGKNEDYLQPEPDQLFSSAPVEAISGWEVVLLINSEDMTRVVDATGDAIQSHSERTLGFMSDSIRRALRMNLLAPFAAMLLIFPVSYKLSHSLADPIVKLTKEAERIGHGEFGEKRTAVTRKDEIGSLARKFFEMEAQLKEYIANLEKATSEKERIATELEVASKIQASVLPKDFSALSAFNEIDIYAFMKPAREVAGDFYDFFRIDDNRVAVVMADVSGKGIPAALFMMMAKVMIRNMAMEGEEPAEIFNKANKSLCEGNEEDMFVTAWLGVIDLRGRRLDYVNAGHEYPFLSTGGGEFKLLKSASDMVLGELDYIRYHQYTVDLAGDECLYLYTDGVTEAAGHSEEMFGRERLHDILNSLGQRELPKLLEGVTSCVDEFADGCEQSDDITMLVVRLNADGKM